MPDVRDAGVAETVRAWVGRRAAADAQMQPAAAARNVRPDEIPDPDETPELLAVLTRQHDHVTAMSKQLQTIPAYGKGATDDQLRLRVSIIDMMRTELSRHESAEQEHLWPAVRRHLPDGDERADTALGQEQDGKDTLAALARTDPASDEHRSLVEQLISQLRAHVAFEDKVFLTLRDATDEDTRRELGKKIVQAYHAAPNRARPRTPRCKGKPTPDEES